MVFIAATSSLNCRSVQVNSSFVPWLVLVSARMRLAIIGDQFRKL
jgi:hypothetical protein